MKYTINFFLLLILFVILIYVNYIIFFKKPYLDLDFLTSKDKINELNDYLINQKQIYSWDTNNFVAKNKKHANSIELTDCLKCENLKSHYDKRLNKGNSEYHIPNENFYKLPKLITFIEELNVFEDIGNITIIINEPNQEGIEHKDHSYKWVSEFIWIRTNDIKKFYVKNNFGIPYYIDNNIIWFDDQRIHNIYPVNEYSFSIRVNGRFNNYFRNWIANQNNFKKSINKKILLDNKSYKLIH